MKRLNRNQLLGIGVMITGIVTSYIFDHFVIGVTSGILAAVGLSLIMKWIPFRKPEHPSLKDNRKKPL